MQRREEKLRRASAALKRSVSVNNKEKDRPEPGDDLSNSKARLQTPIAGPAPTRSTTAPTPRGNIDSNINLQLILKNISSQQLNNLNGSFHNSEDGTNRFCWLPELHASLIPAQHKTR